MRKNLKNSPLAIVLSLCFMLIACGRSARHEAHAETYTCPMHPTVVSDAQGVCPVCSMDLVRKARPGEEVQITGELAQLTKSPNEVVLSSVKTTKGQFRRMESSLEVQGVVSYDPGNIHSISAKVGGRLEQVFIKYDFQSIQKGKKIAEIYSPELVTAFRELLYIVNKDSDNSALITSAKQKLYLLGATDKQIQNALLRNEVTSNFSIYSPYSGYIIRDPQRNVPSSPSSQEDKMTGASVGPTSSMVGSAGELVKEGDYVTRGQTLFSVVDQGAMRIELNLPLSQAVNIRLYDEVDLSLGGNETAKAKIDFLQPFSVQDKEFIKVRLKLQHKGMRIGQLVRATITVRTEQGLWIPRNAVVDLGSDKIIFVKEGDVLKPRKVQTGSSSGEWIHVREGLSTADEFAANAQYLMDSDSFIKLK
jgi:multidrug efflux pump subunit AcrA (membrane-fusion protein)